MFGGLLITPNILVPVMSVARRKTLTQDVVILLQAYNQRLGHLQILKVSLTTKARSRPEEETVSNVSHFRAKSVRLYLTSILADCLRKALERRPDTIQVDARCEPAGQRHP